MVDSPITNPIIGGFAPDPSLILVDGTYFLVNSTFHLFSKSSTLIHGLDNEDHLYATGGLYAPTIRFHNGTFYIVCTNVVNDGKEGKESTLQNFIISTTDIHASKWSDPVYFDFYGIDPSLFFDPTTGKAYLCGSKSPGPETKITLFEIDVNTGKRLSEERQLWHGTGGIYPEGPHIYFRNGLYYLMIAEGGTHEGHSVTMARSKSLEGPWEASPKNPILSAAGTSEYIQATGHCEAFEDKEGQWWGVCLGIRMGAPNLYGLGRETFLTRGTWSDDGWLSFDRAKVNIENLSVVPDSSRRLTAAPGVDFLYIHYPVLSRYKIRDRQITLTASPDGLNSANASPSFVGKRQRRLEGTSSATLLPPAHTSTPITAGLAVYKDEHRFFSLSYTTSSNASSPTIQFHIFNKAKSIDRQDSANLDTAPQTLQLTFEYSETKYKLSYRADSGEVKEFAQVSTMDLSDKDFVGPIVGIFAEGSGEIDFHDFVIDSASSQRAV
ncbi:glycosyl hydrolase [Alternaria rosae]|uniref:glycosyl hydrolase n=1 Tax=Alternaria rosae TaxID=1187941 RepID=UPI001E8E8249|nr:glycosyl hydrolase [Alternaria rosae]KAH6882939.1 glycosyl hydrolase [Alternaria rosae]